MTRQEAIQNIICAWTMRDSEFCCDEKEYEGSRKELNESLIALGVTEAELAK